MPQKGSIELMTSTFEHVLRQRVFAKRTQHSEAPCYVTSRRTRLACVFFAETWQYFRISSCHLPTPTHPLPPPSEKTFILKCMLIEWVCIPFGSNIKFLVLLCRFIAVFYLSCSVLMQKAGGGGLMGAETKKHKASQPKSHRNSCHELNYYFFSPPCLNFLFLGVVPTRSAWNFLISCLRFVNFRLACPRDNFSRLLVTILRKVYRPTLKLLRCPPRLPRTDLAFGYIRLVERRRNQSPFDCRHEFGIFSRLLRGICETTTTAG